jgi:acyl-CoA reductase-like NAD-dependent aldehyde dehydrogenase
MSSPTPRVRVLKTLKMYVGGKFIRSESGRVIAHTSSHGEPMYVCRASRKDFRNTMRIARAAQPGWAARTAYNRGQILYRLAEMLEDRASALPTTQADAYAAADRAVHHAGWADKATAVLSSLNPVASGHVNYSMARAMGVVVAVPDPADGLLGIVEAACAVTVMSNTAIVLVPTERAELATVLGEAMATSDFPGGVVNLLTGDVGGVLDWADKHDDLDGLLLSRGAVSEARFAESQAAAAQVMRRIVAVDGAARAADPVVLGQLSEIKTVWMSS